MNFGLRWLKWIDILVFSSSMSLHINARPSMEFKMGKGLCQRDLLSPFLFLIVAEGLSALMKNVIRLEKFHGFGLNEEVYFKLL